MLATNHLAAIDVKKILFATDFSDSSTKALAYVKKLSHHFGSSVTAMHVVDLSIASQTPEAVVGISLGELRQRGEEGIRQVRKQLRDSYIAENGIVLTGGRAATSIIEFTQETRPDLLVLGTRGKAGLERLILGSTAEDVLRHVSCPVLTIGPECTIADGDDISWHNILYATDFTPDTERAALFALSLAQENNARITLCHIIPRHLGNCADSLRSMFLDELNCIVPEEVRDWCSPEFVVEQGSAATTILKLANEGNADLVVLGIRPSIHLRTHVPAGVTYKVLASAKCPVLTVCGEQQFPWNGFFG